MVITPRLRAARGGFIGIFGIVLFLASVLDVLDGNYAAATAFAVMACYAHLVSTWPARSI